ncbi:MAG TPA: hypothetical protein VN963_07750 [bacterium]|nr:hypothetical protein [bacterium]
METTGLLATTPPTAAEEKREDQFEKALADPDAPSPFHLSVYTRTFWGGVFLLSIILFYITDISGHGSLKIHDESANPHKITRLANH